ncbi:MAG: hypothetical protein HFF69_11785 [Oscillospiraceae bacterium]|jgi:hypothetical protein|nr:hypothetical protein [Oscillospiraceae bacterium]
MNYTQNHHLPQWVGSDPIRMDDFNKAMANIDTGISTAQSDAQAARSAADTARTAASSAKSAADAAQSTANAAQSAASEKPYVVGRYTGTSSQQAIALGFKPSFLIISGAAAAVDPASVDSMAFSGMTAGKTLFTRCGLTASGFSVYGKSQSNPSYPDLNEPGRVYEYIAFK